MTYDEELAREVLRIRGDAFEKSMRTKFAFDDVKVVLTAIEATGCKVVRREQCRGMSDVDGYYRWPDLFDAAPQVPEARDE